MRYYLLLIFLLMDHMARSQSISKRVLIFSKTLKYHHESIPDAIIAIRKLGELHHFTVDTTTNSALFTSQILKKYKAIIFLSTSGNLLDTLQKISLKNFIEAGGGYVGIHSASTSDKDWTWYGHLVGAVFVNHPDPQTAIVRVVDSTANATKSLPKRWSHKDEWYNFRDIQSDLHILLEADETTYTGGTNGPNHPLAWFHAYDGGRSFYTALGHFSETYTDPLYLSHILAGIEYAIGNNKP